MHYLSQKYFQLPLLLRDISNLIFALDRSAKTIQSFVKKIASSDMSYEKFEEHCKETWKEKNSCLRIRRLDIGEKK